MKLPESYFLHHKVTEIAEDLLGKVIRTQINGRITSGIIIETEAYNGIYDKACHAYNHRRTERNEPMYKQGGISYVYLCYGMHHLFNVVTNQENIPDAVLIRGIFPLEGIETILERRKSHSLKNNLTFGPGKVTQALGINNQHNCLPLSGSTISIENRKIIIPSMHINKGPRIGVDYAGEDALLPYRYFMHWKDAAKLFT
jgi:DNA-3-methyladenine glycosylase